MGNAIYNKETKRFMVPEASAVAGKSTKKEYYYLAIDKYLTDQLLNFARADGIDMAAETPQGEKVRQTNAIKMFVEAAISELITAREAKDAPVEEPEAEPEEKEEEGESPN